MIHLGNHLLTYLLKTNQLHDFFFGRDLSDNNLQDLLQEILNTTVQLRFL